MALDWIHDERITRASSSIIAEAAATEAPPPEPLGAAISEQQEQQKQKSQQVPSGTTEEITSSEPTEDFEKKGITFKAENKEVTALNKEREELKAEIEEAEMVDCSSVSTEPQKRAEEMRPGTGQLSRSIEAIHSALMAHPASIFVELDDTEFIGTPFAAASVSTQPSSAVGAMPVIGYDPPDMVLDEVARRLVICLLAGLKTCASHVSDFLSFCPFSYRNPYILIFRSPGK